MNKWAVYLYNYFGYLNINIYNEQGYYYDKEGVLSQTIYKDKEELQNPEKCITMTNYNTMETIGYVFMSDLYKHEEELLNAIIPFVEASIEIEQQK